MRRSMPLVVALVALWGHDLNAATQDCPQTSSTSSHQGTTLQGFATGADGVVYDSAITQLRLNKAGGNFKSTTLPITDTFNIAAVGDFDGDGWTDMVVGSSGDEFIRFYKNRTYDNPAPDWTDTTKVRAPKFVKAATDIVPAKSASGDSGAVAGDFDNDGKVDFFYYRNTADDTNLDYYKIFLGKGDGTFKSPYDATSNVSGLGYFNWSSTNAAVMDYNKDGWPDILFGTKLGSAANKGAVVAMINGCATKWKVGTKCATSPTFSPQAVLSNIDVGVFGVNALGLGDFTGDGVSDLIIGSPKLCGASSKPVRLYPGLAGGGFDGNYQAISTSGAATVMLPADFSLDGKLDLVYGSDNHNCGSNLGGNSYYLKNDGDAAPFTVPVSAQLSKNGDLGGKLGDFDLGIVLDYDHDPDKTADFLIADGNDSGTFFIFANRVISTYVDCGDVASGVLDLGDLASQEMVVTSARMTPTMSIAAGTSVSFFMSNEDPANWQLASACPDKATDYCVSFPRPVGRAVRWKATMCSDSSHVRTPTISGIQIKFDYTPAQEHYRAGVVVNDGVAYVGAFSQPGYRGHFYAINAGMTQTYWDVATKLDAAADGDRKLYTATLDGTTQLPFTTAAATSDDRLRVAFGLGSQAQASSLIAWQRSARFGVGNTSIAMSRLGAIETSTPAILAAPGLPLWYAYAGAASRRDVDTFVAANATRPKLVLFGARDGALHAVHTNPVAMASSSNGSEAWAYVAPKIAFGMAADQLLASPTSYPDGSPTLADIKIDGALRTVLLMNGGNGAKSVFALDVTRTVDPTTGAAVGPDPLWHAVPGGASAGQSTAKVSIARVSLDGTERFLAIVASGLAYDNLAAPWLKGRTVAAYDAATGAQVWTFDAACPVTSDIVTFETDDELEAGEPEVDGYADRAVFADYCGNIYKLALDVAPSGGIHTGLGTVDTGAKDSLDRKIMAVFSVQKTSGALGEQRPIVGTLAARTDGSGRVVMFFGTGGLESFDVAKKNAFYAVYADDGTIRSKLLGTCASNRCQKFYGGIVVTPEQVIMTRSVDPPVGTNACEFGSSDLVGLDLDDVNGGFGVDLLQTIASTTMSSLYGDAGAVYLATLKGDIVRLGTPRAAQAGDDTATGSIGGVAAGGGTGGQGSGSGDSGGGAMALLGWRQVY